MVPSRKRSGGGKHPVSALLRRREKGGATSDNLTNVPTKDDTSPSKEESNKKLTSARRVKRNRLKLFVFALILFLNLFYLLDYLEVISTEDIIRSHKSTTTFNAPRNCTFGSNYYRQPNKKLARVIAYYSSENEIQLKLFLEHYSALSVESIVIVRQKDEQTMTGINRQQPFDNDKVNSLLGHYEKKGLNVWNCQGDQTQASDIARYYAPFSDFVFIIKLNEFIAVLRTGQQGGINLATRSNLTQSNVSAHWNYRDFSNALRTLNDTANEFMMKDGLLKVEPMNYRCSSNNATFCQVNILGAEYIQMNQTVVNSCEEKLFRRGNEVEFTQHKSQCVASNLMLIIVDYSGTIEISKENHVPIYNMISHKNHRIKSTFNDFMRHLAATALVTLAYEGTLGHVFEFVKVILQTSPVGTTYGTVFRNITRERGMMGLYDGFIPWGFIQSLLKGAVFGFVYSVVRAHLEPLVINGIIPTALWLTLSGGIGGGIQGYALSPILLLKTRVMTNEYCRKRMSLFDTTLLSIKIGSSVVKEEGVRSLMKGSNMFALKRFFDWAR